MTNMISKAKLILSISGVLSIAIFASGCSTTNSAQNTPDRKVQNNFPAGGELDFSLAAGYEFNSVVSIDEVEEITGGEDSLLNLRGEIDYSYDINKKTELSIGYAYAQKTHERLSRFDRQNHYFSAGLEHDFGKTEIGVQYRGYDSTRDNDDFVFSNRLRTYLETEITDALELDLFYSFEDKEYDQSVNLDAKDNEFGGQLSWYIDDYRKYFQIRYTREASDAFGPQFDYNADKFRAAYTQRFRLGDKDLRTRVSWSYDMRDYENVTPEIGVRRQDDRHRYQIEFQYPISDNIDIDMDYQRANYQSNLPSADYDRDRFRIGLSYDF